jgi:uncharacterized membrane protein
MALQWLQMWWANLEAGVEMTLIIGGVLLWTVVHFSPSIAPGFRQGLIDKLGAGPYRGVFALTILAAIVLIVIGWRSTPEDYLYVLPAWSRQAGLLLMFIAFVLLGAAHSKTIIKRFIRHPMLMGVFVWSLSHLLTNGTSRALVLFGGLGIWALIEMPLLNSRIGVWEKPSAPALIVEAKGLIISAIIFAVALWLHPYFAGVSPLSAMK